MDNQATNEALERLAKANASDAPTHEDLATDLFGIGGSDYKLPAGAVIDGVVYDHVYVREMTGNEEDILADTNLEVLERMERISTACVTKLVSERDPTKQITDSDVIRQVVSGTLPIERGHSLTSADRIAIMLFIRRSTVGDLYKYEVACQHCGFVNRNMALELDKIEISHNPHPERRRVKVTLPKSKIGAVVKILDGAGEKKASMIRPDDGDYGSLAILTRLESLGDYAMSSLPIKEQLMLVKRMPRLDREYLRQVYSKIEGAVDTDVELSCRKCGRDFSFPLDLGQVFSSTLEDKVSDSDLEWL